MIDVKVLSRILPGTSIGNIKMLLGEPTIVLKQDWELTKDNQENTHSIIFTLDNSKIKITSKDNESIDTTTILITKKNKVDISELLLGYKMVLGETTFTKELISVVRNQFIVRTMKENIGCVQIYLPNPIYKAFSFFIKDNERIQRFAESMNVFDLIGSTFIGVCISETVESQRVYFIFDYEIN
jgi:hypothetical protein